MEQWSRRASFGYFLVGVLALGVAIAFACILEGTPVRRRAAERGLYDGLKFLVWFGAIFGMGCFWRIIRFGGSHAAKVFGLFGLVGSIIVLIIGGASGRPRSHISTKNWCVNNLRQIDGAKEQWVLEKAVTNGAPIVEVEVAPYIKGGKIPACPEGGRYFLGNVDEPPRCSVKGHTL